MKTTWQTKKLGEIIELKYGKGIGKHERRENASYPVYGANGILGYADKALTSGEAIIVGRKGSAGEVTRVSGKFWPSDVTYYIFGNSHISIDFLFYLFQLIDLKKFARGVKPGINRNDVYQIDISFPSLKEQKKIIKVLNEVFEKIEKAKKNTEKNLQNSHELFEAYLQNIFENPDGGWIMNELKELTTKIGSGATPRGGKKDYKENGISLVRSLNVYDRGFKRKNLAYIDEKQADKLSNVTLEQEDILLNITGASIARCCIVPLEILPARVNQHVSIIRIVKERMSPEFLHYALTSKKYKDRLLYTGSKGGSTRQAVTKSQIENFMVQYPRSLSEQKSIVKKLDELSEKTKKLELIYTQKLADLEELKKSILQKAFADEL
ncbi:MAG TPA: restriction endonuclease subunit S [Candidatus Sulfotelmatobacter sp.]|jgi:type I restriction enzyme S subunit|nr:restriction endonuclease subunit S [Candidatus Sulfotelmatobacter sp.]